MKKLYKPKRYIALVLIAALLVLGLFGCVGTVAAGESAPAQAAPVAEKFEEVRALRVPADTFIASEAALADAVPVEAAPVKAQVINVLEFIGDVTVDSGGVTMPAYDGMRLSAGDKLKTGANANAMLDLNNGGIVMVEDNSALEITQSNAEYIEVSLLSGNIVNSIEKGAGKYAVKTNNVTMGVLGTVFRVSLTGGTAKIDLYEGAVALTFITSAGEEVTLTLGEGLSFTGTDDAINDSIESEELVTTPLDLTKLPDDALNWITQQLENRESVADDPAMLDEMVEKLQEEIERRKKPPAEQPAPVADAAPASSGPSTSPDPSLTWGEHGIAVDPDEGTNLNMAWGTKNGTGTELYGFRWSVEDWNNELLEREDLTKYTYDGETYSFQSCNYPYCIRTVWGLEEHLTTPAMLYVLLVPGDFNGETVAQVYDSQTVTVRNQTPNISATAFGESTEGINMTVSVVPPTNDIENYSTVAGEPASPANPTDPGDPAPPTDPTDPGDPAPPSVEPVVIPVADGSAVIPISNEQSDLLFEQNAQVYPNGDTNGVAVASVEEGSSAGAVTVDVYLPTTVAVEVLPEP